MPYGFGPSPGPCSGPDGRLFGWTETPARRAVAVSFLSDADALQRLLPPGFTVRDEPVVTVEVQLFTELAWLAGRGYSTLGVKWPATFTGARDTATGPFLSVLWENLADPILTGRDELGFAKLYAGIDPPRVLGDRETHAATWLGHRFLDPMPASPQPAAATSAP
jgi:acetoacetate decarboxylase